MHAPRSLFQRHEVPEQNRRKPVVQGPLTAKGLESVIPFFAGDDLGSFQLTGFGHLFDQLFRHDQHFVSDADKRIVDLGMHRDGLVGRKRPGCGRPNDDGNFFDAFEAAKIESFP